MNETKKADLRQQLDALDRHGNGEAQGLLGQPSNATWARLLITFLRALLEEIPMDTKAGRNAS